MTIERPMFPPRAEEHCQIILLVIGRKAAGVSPSAAAIRIELEHTAPRVRPPDGISETLKNRNLRDGRKPQWSKAEAAREYWRARLDMESGISTAQRHGIPEGTNHPPHIADDRWTLLANWPFGRRPAYDAGTRYEGNRLEKGGLGGRAVAMDRPHKGAHRARNRR
jgi:hypothetical protein